MSVLCLAYSGVMVTEMLPINNTHSLSLLCLQRSYRPTFIRNLLHLLILQLVCMGTQLIWAFEGARAFARTVCLRIRARARALSHSKALVLSLVLSRPNSDVKAFAE